jgi:hypothetical protein
MKKTLVSTLIYRMNSAGKMLADARQLLSEKSKFAFKAPPLGLLKKLGIDHSLRSNSRKMGSLGDNSEKNKIEPINNQVVMRWAHQAFGLYCNHRF